MKFRPTNLPTVCSAGSPGFTLAEVLAALAFMAIVIPVAVEGIRIANQAGVVAQRKSAAVRIAERVLNETVILGTSKQGASSGVVEEGALSYRWQIRSENWNKDGMRQLTAVVTYSVQGQEHDVRVATLMDSTEQ